MAEEIKPAYRSAREGSAPDDDELFKLGYKSGDNVWTRGGDGTEEWLITDGAEDPDADLHPDWDDAGTIA